MIWFLIGWNPDLLIGNHDQIQGNYPYFKLLELHQFKKINYTNTIHGGAYISPIVGSSILNTILYKMGLSVGNILNLGVIICQTLVGFFSFSLIKDFTDFEDDPLADAVRIIVITLFISFNPILSWRIEHGHLNLLWAVSFFFAFGNMLGNVKVNKYVSYVEMFLTWVTGINALSQHGLQLIFYMLPFFIYYFFKFSTDKKNHSKLGLLLVLIMSIAIFISTDLWSFLKFTLSGLGSREVETNALYSYITYTLKDLDTFFILNSTLLNSERSPFLNHEMHYPLIIPFLVFIFYWDSLEYNLKRSAVLYSIISLLILFLCFNPPVLGWLLERIPVISSFRIIGRANILCGLVLYVLTTTTLLTKKIDKVDLIVILMLIPISILMKEVSWILEIILWAFFVLTMSFKKHLKNKFVKIINQSFLYIILLSTFSSTLGIVKPIINFREIDSVISATRNYINSIQINPNELFLYQGPLKKVIGLNTTMALGVGGIEGYWFATKTVNEIYSKSLNSEVQGMRMLYPIISLDQAKFIANYYPLSQAISCSQTNCSSLNLNDSQHSKSQTDPINFIPTFMAELTTKLLSIILLTFLVIAFANYRRRING